MKFHLPTQVKLKWRPSLLHKACTSPPQSDLSSWNKHHFELHKYILFIAFINNVQQPWLTVWSGHPTKLHAQLPRSWVVKLGPSGGRGNNRLSRPMEDYYFCLERSSSGIFSVVSPGVAKVLARALRAFQDKAIISCVTILGIPKVNECATMLATFFF